MEWLYDPQIWLSLVSLSVLEIVLGIDNLVFLAILTDRLPEERRPLAERLGLAFALLARLGLLAAMVWVLGLAVPVFEIFGQPVSWRDIVLIGGGIFLLAKATHEIHGALEGDDDEAEDGAAAHPVAAAGAAPVTAGLWRVALQMGVLDLVFSLDSVITAVGMASRLWVMAAAMVVAMALMLAAAAPLSNFLGRHPTVRMLALAFLIMIGLALVADGLGVHVPKGAIYFAMGFSAAIEGLNLLAKRRQKPVRLRHPLP